MVKKKLYAVILFVSQFAAKTAEAKPSAAVWVFERKSDVKAEISHLAR